MLIELLKRMGGVRVSLKFPSPSKPATTDFVERRRYARPLPVPDVVECDEDSAWAEWQEAVALQEKMDEEVLDGKAHTGQSIDSDTANEDTQPADLFPTEEQASKISRHS